MREEDLELLITLDDPGEEEDALNHLQAENNAASGSNQQFPASGPSGHTAEVTIENDPYTVTFGQGEWTCTLMKFTGTTNDSLKGPAGIMMQLANRNFEIECCRISQWKDGKIVEEKVFYELVGLRSKLVM